MSTTTRFYVGFLVVALLVAGGLSYFASSAPDGLDMLALHGCQAVTGPCRARSSRASASPRTPPTTGAAGSPLADYSLLGDGGTVGPAGIIGVLARSPSRAGACNERGRTEGGDLASGGAGNGASSEYPTRSIRAPSSFS